MKLQMLEDITSKIRLSFYGSERQKIDNLWHNYKVALVAWQSAFNKTAGDKEKQRLISIQVCSATNAFMVSLKLFLGENNQYYRILGELIRLVTQKQNQLKECNHLRVYCANIHSAGQLLDQTI
ncbi:hypothetical protein COT94_04230 [Candidatus Falkowbacteria bacterium CG10_big_fil_rev_8_21_14_0_10_37_14]|uniref:Uncharacterized protein n=1 Tax=Candidatus Falkowbacteria bacterium CG10_big_fil_rev_8_21_14_0_10_37_14 TaxID=1974561 RepID=A0A2M6WSN4_9BACT|nr:hypothetical protein [Candidatus Falkowbacteria bacterium]PIT95765.1 MAG: hypothetical protein COT94_04230 [Candidatus Falkowbacteria bacterium CG10_big_fil_rev_8_21_14_0_10_37_14]